MKKTLMYEQLTDLYPLFRESMEERKGTEKTETNFIARIFKGSKFLTKSVIDLGGGIGMHAKELAKRGYEVTVFDQSQRALRIARMGFPKLKTIQGRFEAIATRQTFDVAICLWSTFPYILTDKGRKNFFNWLKTHIKYLIILDEANFHRYLKMKEFHKIYKLVEDKRYRLTLTRDWIISSTGLRKTSYVYTITDRKTEKQKIIQDWEVQQYLSVDEIQKYLGGSWKLKGVFGDFKPNSRFDKQSSPRLISVFERKESIPKSLRSQ